MSLFRDLGERVERFKQQAVDASRDRAEYACRACGEPVYTERAQCPHCGSDDVARVVREDSASTEEGDAREASEREETEERGDRTEGRSGGGGDANDRAIGGADADGDDGESNLESTDVNDLIVDAETDANRDESEREPEAEDDPATESGAESDSTG